MIYLEFFKEFFMDSQTFDFYDRTSLKSYNLDSTMKYQLNMLDNLDTFTRKHSENVANLTCRLCQKLHCQKGFTRILYNMCLFT